MVTFLYKVYGKYKKTHSLLFQGSRHKNSPAAFLVKSALPLGHV